MAKLPILHDFIKERCVYTGEHTLSTGIKSDIYFDCKKITLDGEIVGYLADAFLEMSLHLPAPTAIGGLTMGADAISIAVAMRSIQIGGTIKQASIVRKEPKKYGTQNLIENLQPHGTKIVVVDDVITSGFSANQAASEFLDAGYNVVGFMSIIDREQGGKEWLEEIFGVPVLSLFLKSDFKSL